MSVKNKVEISNHDWGRIHAKAWLDPAFRHKLETDPTSALREFAKDHGLAAQRLVCVEDRPKDLTDDQLKEIVEGRATFEHSVIACC
jgi:hypothetical protein